MSPCSRCGSSDLVITDIDDQNITHVICEECENEWVQ